MPPYDPGTQQKLYTALIKQRAADPKKQLQDAFEDSLYAQMITLGVSEDFVKKIAISTTVTNYKKSDGRQTTLQITVPLKQGGETDRKLLTDFLSTLDNDASVKEDAFLADGNKYNRDTIVKPYSRKDSTETEVKLFYRERNTSRLIERVNSSLNKENEIDPAIGQLIAEAHTSAFAYRS